MELWSDTVVNISNSAAHNVLSLIVVNCILIFLFLVLKSLMTRFVMELPTRIIRIRAVATPTASNLILPLVPIQRL